MAHANGSTLPPGFRETGFFADFIGIGEKDLARHGEDGRIGEAREQRREKIGLDAHIAIQEHDDVVSGGREAGVGTASKAEIFGQGENAGLRKMLLRRKRRCRR